MIHEVVAQHAEMAAFLWELREMAARSHHYTLADLAELEERIEAHLDGLRIAGEPAWEILLAALGEKEPGVFFAAAVSAVEAKDYPGFAAVLDAAAGEAPALAGVAGALAWASPADAFAMVDPMLAAADPPALLGLGIATCAAHRRDPGRVLSDALYSKDAGLTALALRAAGELGRADLARELAAASTSEDAAARYYSSWSGALLGLRGAAEALWVIARDGGPFAEDAADCAARVTPPADARARIEALATWPGMERVSLIAAGALGDPALLPWVLDRLESAPLARLAAEAVSRITGAAIEGPLRALPPEGFTEGPTDNPADTDVLVPPETHLSWPNATNVKAHCASHRLPAGARHAEGRPLDDAALDRVLRGSVQRRRAGAAFERAARAPGRPLFNVTARAVRQAAALGGLA